MGKEGGGRHDKRGVKEEARRWRMLMMTMIVISQRNQYVSVPT
jgi:hypothetical protein